MTPNTPSTPAFQNFIKTQLNPAQQQAVQHCSGPLLVIAGAGSGKTRVITARITNLIVTHHVSPHSIVALTFTNKAAQEMKERIAHFLPDKSQLPFVGTFHAYCVRLLKQHSNLIAFPAFTILDTDDQAKILQGILTRAGINKTITARTAAYQISQIKNQLVNPLDNPLFSHPYMQQVYMAYEREKRESKCFDFDDLMLEILRLFKTNSTFKALHQQRVRHVLVDEYQDTNGVQHELLKQMALTQITPEKSAMHEKNGIPESSSKLKSASSTLKKFAEQNFLVIDSVCAVGDEDQSIYSWRGATIANMLNFQKDFGNTTLIKIEQNYRSVQPILDLANTVIEHNNKRNSKKLWSDKKGTDRIRVFTCLSEYQEGELFAQCIKVARAKQKAEQPDSTREKQQDIAILYRTHVQSRAIEEALIKHSIPYKIIGGIQFYERKEVKDLLAYLRLLVNPFDRPSFFRIINTPARSLGAKFEELFYNYWSSEPFLTFAQVAQRLLDDEVVKNSKKVALLSFVSLFADFNPTTLPSVVLETIIKKIKYIDYLKESYETQEAQERIDNLQELVDALRYFEVNGVNTVELFLHEVALMQEKVQKQDSNQNPVLMMSLHAAKGLEFDMVLLAGMEEGIIPSTRSLESDDAVEEERRLFYVGITRAREYLMLTHTKYRYTYGKMVDQFTSRFLDEVPARLAQRQDTSYVSQALFRSIFSDWLNQNNSGANTSTYSSTSSSNSTRSGTSSDQDPVFTFSQFKQPAAALLPEQSLASPTARKTASYAQQVASHIANPARPARSHVATTGARITAGNSRPAYKATSAAQKALNKSVSQPSTRTATRIAPRTSAGRSTSRSANSFNKPNNSPKLNTPEIRSGSKGQDNALWRKNQPVQHAQYGVGIVELCEEKGTDTYVTVRFKVGVKKISAKFLQAV
jgi:DNA helicase-2/ATP-dependent DNA helicase PcrA